ncbi:uncharacterized protein LOC144171555 [Haemaphysalis longicornis]|uniref:Uncharacterized protein n=1 Tax=Haemaphysalis longicornis TaxID=44386 RepID=A0A9J6FHV3_HAELO|nr:hypothetical protein HPB48_014947 [Haemaphysalis longicornis]
MNVFPLLVAVLVLVSLEGADALFLSTLSLLPISAIVSLGGVGGLKLAIAMKILGMLGWWDVSRYGVGLRASIENNRLPERVVPLPKPQSIFSGPTISVPIALLPYFIGGRLKSPTSIRLPVKDFVLLANQSARFESPKVKFSSEGSATVKGTKGSQVHASGEFRSPLVNVEAEKTATLRGRRSIESDPRVVKEAVSLVKELDSDRCILRLSCEVSADPSSYGTYGRRVADFMTGLGPVGSDSAFVDFETAYRRGRSAGVAGCTRSYATCKFDLRALVALVESS